MDAKIAKAAIKIESEKFTHLSDARGQKLRLWCATTGIILLSCIACLTLGERQLLFFVGAPLSMVSYALL